MGISRQVRKWISRRLTIHQKRLLKHSHACLVYRGNLDGLATAFGTDKNNDHFYTQHYQHHFQAFRNKKINLLEIGIGGYDDPHGGGQSLRMWKAFFPHANIYGLDVYDKSFHNEHRIKTFTGSQVDEALLSQIINEMGSIDIIIDDGSHLVEHVIKTFSLLFPVLSDNGIYAIEDLQTSYWAKDAFGNDWGGSSNLDASFTSMNFLKRLADCLNHQEFMLDNYESSYFDRHITGLHFYHNLAFINKGNNDEIGDGLRRLRGW